MYHSLSDEYRMEIQDKKRVVAMLNEAKIKEAEIFSLLKKYCNIDHAEALNLLQNEKFINAPCRKLEQFLLLEKGYSYEEIDLFINKYTITTLAKNPELSKMTPAKLYAVTNKHGGKQEKLLDD